MADDFDLVVLGGGPGGYAAALYAASAGLRVALVEEERLGGTCLHRGCIPAKELLQTAEVLRTVRGAAEFGVEAGSPVLDLARSQDRKQRIVDRLATGLETLCKQRKVTVVGSRGELVGPGTIRAGDGREVVGRFALVATGSAPRELALPGLAFDGERILSSDEVLGLREVPGRVAVVGGGAIGCEFASLLCDLGSEVTVLEALDEILAGVDGQVAQTVRRSFTRRGISVRTGVHLVSAEVGPGGVTLRIGSEESLEVDRVVVAVGRRPRSDGVGLEAAGVTRDEAGYVVVDGNLRTSVDGVFAVGDVVRTPALAHVAFGEAIVAVRTMLGENPTPIDYDRVPWGIYCHPEVAFCGLTEDQARARGHDVVVSVHRWGGNGRALILGEAEGVMKLVAERDGPLLGVHLAGPWATELLAEAHLAVNWEATPSEIAALVHAHPTLSELFGESALALTGRSLH